MRYGNIDIRWSDFFLYVGVVALSLFGVASIMTYRLVMIMEGVVFLGCLYLVGETHIDENHPKWKF